MRKRLISLVALCAILLSGCTNAAKTSISQDTTKESINIDSTSAVTQEPELPPQDTTVSAQEFVDGLGMGWNLGNSLDPDGRALGVLQFETSWGNPRTRKELISFIKSEGFSTIRIPVTWFNHISAAPDYKINEKWIERVKEIVDWCLEEDLNVIINIHHESSWLTKASTDYEGVMAQYTAIWTQIADYFGDYSDKLVFESMNEIGFDDLGTAKGCELMNKINAEFVKLIRHSGKNNLNRYLLLAGYWTDIDRSCEEPGIQVPEGDAKLMVSLHYYSPSTFAIADKNSTWGYQETWGTEEDYVYLDGQMQKVKAKFIDKGIPVIMGEYGCTVTDKDPESRINYLAAVAKACRDYHICPILWDKGDVINRASMSWKQEGLKEKLFGLE